MSEKYTGIFSPYGPWWGCVDTPSPSLAAFWYWTEWVSAGKPSLLSSTTRWGYTLASRFFSPCSGLYQHLWLFNCVCKCVHVPGIWVDRFIEDLCQSFKLLKTDRKDRLLLFLFLHVNTCAWMARLARTGRQTSTIQRPSPRLER